MLIIAIPACLALLGVAAFLYWDCRKPPNFPPGPAWLPIVGNVPYFRKRLEVLKYHHLVWAELAEKYGPVVGLRMGRILVVTVSGVEAVKEVLNREEFDGRPDGFFFRLRTFGKRLGVVFSDGGLWQKQRKFSLQHLRNFGLGRREMELQIEEEARELIDSLRSKCSIPIFMHDAFDISVMNVLWTMLAGRRFDLDDERLARLLGIVHDAFRSTDMSGGLLNQMPFLRHLAPGACGYTKLLGILKRMWDFLEETISDHRQSVCGSHARDLIDAFLQKMNVSRDAETTFTDEQLLALCLDLFMAGSETTSNTLAFAVLYMLAYPEVQAKVQEELARVIGRNRWPSVQDRTSLPYTEAVLMEIQRRANVPPLGIAHRALVNVRLLGCTIPENAIVLPSLYSVHTDRNHWRNPMEFEPERFLNSGGKLEVPENCYMPFGQGKRRCLGESLAKTSYYLFFTALLHNFHLEKEPGGGEPSLEGYDGVTISPKPFKVWLVPRSD